jgi:hypothetical protein
MGLKTSSIQALIADSPTVIHSNVAGEITAVADKPTPVAGDYLLIEDSENSNNKKSILIGNLPAGVFTPTGYVHGCRLSPVFPNNISVGPGLARSSDDSFTIVNGSTLTADLLVSGANGLDVGVGAINNWYAVYLIADTSTVNPPATLLSLSFTAPTLPVGYDKFRRVGCVYNSSAFALFKYLQVWNGTTRRYWYDENLATTNFISSSSVVFLAVPLIFMPPSSTNAVFHVGISSGSSVLLRPGGSGTTTPSFGITTAGAAQSRLVEMPCPNQTFELKVIGGGTTSISIAGFDDEL